MDGHVPDIRLKSGIINFPNGLNLNFIFGLVYNINGLYFFELHFDQTIELEKFYRKYEKEFYNTDYKLIATTIDGDRFEATQIWMKSFPFHKSMGDFYCYGSIQITQQSRNLKNNNLKELTNSVHFILVEGLKMSYDSHSKYKEVNFGKNHKYPFKMDGTWDYSTVTFQLEDLSSYMFHLYNKSDEQVIIEFNSENQFQELSYDKWLEIKIDFLEFLSFLNGASVIVREEHFGEYWSPKELKGEISVYYSQEKNLPRRHNDFMAINNSWYRSENIIQNAFMYNFSIYREKNKIWDLNSIIFYLNNAEQTHSIGDKIFIQTILLERLSSTFADSLNSGWQNIIPEDIFELLSEDLQNTLKKHEGNIEKAKYNILKSRLSELNNAKRNSNRVKFKNLIEGVGIQITDNIDKLLTKRNIIIHRGEIGKINEAIQDFELMDKLLRKIIVNIIGYKGATIEDGKQYKNPPIRLINDLAN
jgi:hypothetical protein